MKYSEDIKMEIGGKFINGDYANNYKLLHKDLDRLTKSAISEQLTLTDVSNQRELLISFAEYLKDRALINVTKENLPIRVDLYLKRD